jgi:hypothetical protein
MSLAALFLAALAVFSAAGESSSIPELSPRLVTFSSRSLPLETVLQELHKQTGNMLEDRRSNKINVKLSLPAGPRTFWQVLDAIGDQDGIGFSAYQPDGGVALVDAPVRKLKTCYSGLFRFAVKRTTVIRDDESQTHTCRLALDVAWEPRFQPLYLNVERGEVSFKAARGMARETLERESPAEVAGTSATELDLRLKAPDRTTTHLDTLKGTIRVIGPPKMLDFAFMGLKPVQESTARHLEIEKVKVSLTSVKQTPSRWTVDVLVEYPNGAIIPLDSYQRASWMINNRIWLEWTDPKSKVVQKLEPSNERFLTEMKRQFVFSPPPSAEVTLHYRTPNRILAFTVPFEFRDVRLP